MDGLPNGWIGQTDDAETFRTGRDMGLDMDRTGVDSDLGGGSSGGEHGNGTYERGVTEQARLSAFRAVRFAITLLVMTSGPSSRRPTAGELIELFGLEPLPVEGGQLVQTWRSDEVVDADDVDAGGKRAGTAAIAMLTDEPDSFSAIHRLPTTEVWHFYLGDPIQMLLLRPDGTVERPVLGPDVLGGQHIQVVVAPGTWMGARLVPGGEYGLFGCTMAPGFTTGDYEGGTLQLTSTYPDATEEIESLVRPDAPTRMPSRP